MLELHHMSRRIALACLALLILVIAGCAQVPRASVVGEQEQISIVDRPPMALFIKLGKAISRYLKIVARVQWVTF